MFLKGGIVHRSCINFTVLFFFFLIPRSFTAQVSNEHKIQEILQDIYEQTGSNVKYEEIEFYLENPKPLGKYKPEELTSITCIPINLAKKIILMYNKKIEVDSICDSLKLSLSQCALLKLISYQEKYTLNEQKEANLAINLRSRFYYSPNKLDKHILGDPIDSYQRITLTSKLFDLGFSISKDPGERSYFDSYKLYFHKNLDNVSLILGHFIVKNSNGLILWYPYSPSKTPPSVFSVLSNDIQIQPTLTTSSFGTFRGIAGKISFSITQNTRLIFSPFVAKTPRSGSMDSTGKIVTSFYTSDLFIEPKEVLKRDNIDETTYFLFLQFISQMFSISYSHFYIMYDKYVQTSTKKFFTGSSALFNSISTKVTLSKNLNLLNEFAVSKLKDKALINNIMFQKNLTSALMSFRYLSPTYRSPFGMNIGENSYPNNELGILFATQFKIKPLSCEILLDNFKTLQPISNLEFPIFGNDFYLQAYFPISSANIKVRLERKEKTDYVKSMDNTKQIPYQKVQYRFMGEMKFAFFKKVDFISRIDYTKLNYQGFKSNESGFNCFFQINSEILKDWDFSTRFNVFSTASFESSVYVFEYFAPGLMQSVAYNGKGVKIILNSILRLIENKLRFYVRYYYDSKTPQKHFILAQTEITWVF
ncbi:MAG: hypothetical protein ACUVQ1_06775 [Candidatus Kapaibacteriales bacterium]